MKKHLLILLLPIAVVASDLGDIHKHTLGLVCWLGVDGFVNRSTAFDVSPARNNSASMVNMTTNNGEGYDRESGFRLFNVNSMYLSVPDHDSLDFTDGAGNDKPFSIALWARFQDATTGGLVSKITSPTSLAGFDLRTSAADKLFLVLYGGNGTTYIGRSYNTAVAENVWLHIVTTYDGSESSAGIRIYIDAVRVDDTNFNGGSYTGMSNTTQPLEVGLSGFGGYFYGNIRDVRIYNRALGVDEVTDLYRFSRRTFYPLTDTYIIAGQSNAHGVETNTTETIVRQALIYGDRVVGRWQPLTSPSDDTYGSGPEFTIATNFTKVGFIKHAESGKDLANEFNPSGGANWTTLTNYISLAQVRDALWGRETDIRGMFWIQGEADSRVEAEANAYFANLTNLITKVRSHVGKSDMPFVIALTHTNDATMTYVGTVRTAQTNAATALANVYWVETSDLEMMSDNVHFSEQGQRDLGGRLYEALP